MQIMIMLDSIVFSVVSFLLLRALLHLHVCAFASQDHIKADTCMLLEHSPHGNFFEQCLLVSMKPQQVMFDEVRLFPG